MVSICRNFHFVLGFAFVQIGNIKDSIYFSISIFIAFGFLAIAAQLLMWAVKKFFPSSASYLWRQSLSNLYRPNNQTLVLIASIGLGTALITTLYFVQNLLINEVEITTDNDRPNLMIFDIQTYQKDELVQLTRENDLPVLQQVPIVTMRLSQVNGNNYQTLMADSTLDLRGGIFRREWRVTYRDSLIDSETIIEGELKAVENINDSTFVSLEERYAKSAG